MNRLLLSTAALALCLTTSLLTHADGLASDDPAVKGYAIAARSDRSDVGFGSSSVRLTMTLRDRQGRETVRDLQIDTLEKAGEGNGDKSMTRFFSPPDVEGTALLSHARVLESDNQWLYLPALRRVKRISSSNKSGPFVGSEFAFEDLTGNELGKYGYTYLGTETLEDGTEVDKVQCEPLYERSGYTKLHCYFDTQVFQSRKVEFFDRGGQLFKTLELTDYREYAGGVWRPHRQVMTNHLTGKSTVLEAGQYDFSVNLNRSDFEPGALDAF
ncbi:MAG: outer membrane lipoprotein-sorting protein [Pseudomonadota bacterium]